ncbi:MAG: helix-turn-helix domain-containing protein [Chloroflexota bacterium]|nr:helix-turn-helix domain-containing protein [Chloroflexota bacterium]
MPSREDPLDLGTRRGDRLVREVAQAARAARHAAGLSQKRVAAVLGVSRAQVSRYERGARPLLDLREAARLMRLLGQDLAISMYPAAGPLRDAGHAALVARFLKLLHPTLPHRLEAPVPIPRDQRAWDVLLDFGVARVGVAVETRLRDWQALLRREQLKARDARVDHLLLVMADTHANRRAVREAGDALRAQLPLDGRALRPALREGRDPGASGLLML